MREILAIILFLLGCVSATSAQIGQSLCGTRSATYFCPVGSKVLLSGTTDGLFVAKGEAPVETGLFVLPLGSGAADEEALNELLDRVFQVLYSRKLVDFQLKESREFRNAPDWRYSKFEEMRYQKVAFDALSREMLHLHVVVISADGKRTMAGFVRSFLKGDIAKSAFKGWTMGSGSGPNDLLRLVHSITKEEDPNERRGAPKPAAASKKP